MGPRVRSILIVSLLLMPMADAPSAWAQGSGNLVHPDAPIPTAPVEVDGVVPFGYLAAMLAKNLGPVRLQLTGKGMSVDFGDEDIDFFELDGLVSVRLWAIATRIPT